MSSIGIKGKAQTVLGPLDADRLGITLPHEHLLIDVSCVFTEPNDPDEKMLGYQPVTLENLGWIRYHSTNNLDNLRLLDEEIAINEAGIYKQAGGQTIVAVSNIGLGRDPMGLACIAQATGLNIIMGSGYYVAASHPPEMNSKTQDDITAEIIRDVSVGVGETSVRAGIIGEIGCSWPWTENEQKVVRAAAVAQRQTGAPLMIHPGRHETAPFKIIKVLTEVGADLSRTIMCHVERTFFDLSYNRKLAEAGCYLEYDLFGWEYSYYPLAPIDMPNDGQRLNQIAQLIDEGFVNQILLSHDICFKSRLRCYGGHGYAHILRNVVPKMRQKGFREEHIHTMLVENPKRVLQFV